MPPSVFTDAHANVARELANASFRALRPFASPPMALSKG